MAAIQAVREAKDRRPTGTPYAVLRARAPQKRRASQDRASPRDGSARRARPRTRSCFVRPSIFSLGDQPERRLVVILVPFDVPDIVQQRCARQDFTRGRGLSPHPAARGPCGADPSRAVSSNNSSASRSSCSECASSKLNRLAKASTASRMMPLVVREVTYLYTYFAVASTVFVKLTCEKRACLRCRTVLCFLS